MEWGNCHLDPMSCSEKAQLVGVVEGAPWQSYTNSILSFCCSFFFWVSPLPHCRGFGAPSALWLSTINTADNLSTVLMKLKTGWGVRNWLVCTRQGHDDTNGTFPSKTFSVMQNLLTNADSKPRDLVKSPNQKLNSTDELSEVKRSSHWPGMELMSWWKGHKSSRWPDME